MRTPGTKSIPRAAFLPGGSLLEVIRSTAPEFLFTSVRERARLIRELTWARSPAGELVSSPHGPTKPARALQNAVARAYALAPGLTEPHPEAAKSGRIGGGLHAPRTGRRARSFESSMRVASTRARPVEAPTMLAGRAFARGRGPTVPTLPHRADLHRQSEKAPGQSRPRRSLDLVWPSRTADTAASVGFSSSTVAPSGSERTAAVDLTPVPSPAAKPQPQAPNVDTLVDEVMRRLDRNYRVERMRRGI